MITYTYPEGDDFAPIKVRLDGRLVGEIRKLDDGWRYVPRGNPSFATNPFPTLRACQRSIES